MEHMDGHGILAFNALLVAIIAYWCMCLGLRRYFLDTPTATIPHLLVLITFGLLVLVHTAIGRAAFSALHISQDIYAAKDLVFLTVVTGTFAVVLFAAYFGLGGFRVLLTPLLLIPEPRTRQAVRSAIGASIRKRDVWVVCLVMAAFTVSTIGGAYYLLWVVLQPLPNALQAVVRP